MRRLIVKELLENRIYLLGMLAGTAILLGLGVPLDFRGLGHQGTNWIGVVIILSMLMGVSAYSRELLAETLPFLITRPVRWWWVYLSKLLAGLIACAAIGIAAAIIYVVTVPAEYRPFMGIWSLLEGAGTWALLLGMGYAAGFLFSCVLGGMVASLAVLALTWILAVALWVGIAPQYQDLYPLIAIPIAAVAASVACAKAPKVVQTWPRVRRWLGIMAVGFILTTGASLLLPRVWRGPERLDDHPSPDRQLTVFAASKAYMTPRISGLWVRTREGRDIEIESGKKVQMLAWSPDSRALYYAILRGGAAQIKGASEDNRWRSFPIGKLVSLRLGSNVSLQPIIGSRLPEVAGWSPSGDRFLVCWSSARPPLESLMVADVRACKAWRVPGRTDRGCCWWVDDEHIASVEAGVIAVTAGEAEQP